MDERRTRAELNLEPHRVIPLKPTIPDPCHRDAPLTPLMPGPWSEITVLIMIGKVPSLIRLTRQTKDIRGAHHDPKRPSFDLLVRLVF